MHAYDYAALIVPTHCCYGKQTCGLFFSVASMKLFAWIVLLKHSKSLSHAYDYAALIVPTHCCYGKQSCGLFFSVASMKSFA